MSESADKDRADGMLDGKTIVVTGCASGIGWETAKQIGRHGGRVIGVDINEPAGNVDDFRGCDLSDRVAMETLVKHLPDGIDGIANVAGLPPTAPPEMVLLVNLVGLKFFTETMISKLRDGASIVNVASLAGSGWIEATTAIKASEGLDFRNVSPFVEKYGVGREKARSYFFSKEALVVWTMQCRWKWRDRGIRMNTVSPGPVDTPILKDFIATLGPRDSLDKRLVERFGTPEDVAPVICFLLSDMTRWIRGANIPVDGGMYAHLQCKMHEL